MFCGRCIATRVIVYFCDTETVGLHRMVTCLSVIGLTSAMFDRDENSR